MDWDSAYSNTEGQRLVNAVSSPYYTIRNSQTNLKSVERTSNIDYFVTILIKYQLKLMAYFLSLIIIMI